VSLNNLIKYTSKARNRRNTSENQCGLWESLKFSKPYWGRFQSSGTLSRVVW